MKAPIWYIADRTATQYETYSLAAVLNSFSEKILPPVFVAVQKLLPDGAFIAGGYLMEVLADLPRNDIDVWFSSAEAADTFRETLRGEIRTGSLASYEFYERMNPLTGASTFLAADHTVISLGSYIFKDITDALDSFDFTVAQLALTGEDRCYAGPTTIADIKSKRLVFHRIQPTLYNRTRHYIKKGFKPSEEASATIAQNAPALSMWTPPPPPEPVVQAPVPEPVPEVSSPPAPVPQVALPLQPEPPPEDPEEIERLKQEYMKTYAALFQDDSRNRQ